MRLMNNFDKLTVFRQYSIIQQLRVSAGQSDIYVVRRNDDESLTYLLKLYRFGSAMNKELIGRILCIGEKNPDNLIKIYDCGYDENTGKYYEVMEYIKFGSLNRLIALMNDENRGSIVRLVIKQVIEGLNILHDNNILHLDLKPSNILIRSDKPFNIVLTDFGLSSIIDHDASKAQSRVNKGTDDYRSPESYSGMYYKKTDYWSLGIILYELMLGSSPFAGKTPAEITGIVVLKNMEISEKIDRTYYPILKGLLTKDVNLRWGYEEVSKWLAGETVEYESENRYKKPYEFENNNYYTLKELVAAFVLNEKNMKASADHFSKGRIIKWLEAENDFDTAIALENLIVRHANDSHALLSEMAVMYCPEYLINILHKTKSIDLGDGVKIDMVLMLPGKFSMGASEGDNQLELLDIDFRPLHSDNYPHAVSLSKGFYIGKYPVTQKQWTQVTRDNPSEFKKGGDYPVESVSWEDCQEFIKKLNIILKDNQKLLAFEEFRLPTEAEWEYACRAGTQSTFYWGNLIGENKIDDHCWHSGNSYDSTHPAGQKKPNRFGLFDMSGNVFEWCGDWYSDNYYSNSVNIDPAGPESGLEKCLRGGSWYSSAKLCHSASRFSANPEGCSQYCGLRLVLAFDYKAGSGERLGK